MVIDDDGCVTVVMCGSDFGSGQRWAAQQWCGGDGCEKKVKGKREG